MRRRVIPFAALLLLASVPATAQQTDIVIGIVRDSATTRPLSGTLVTLTGQSYPEVLSCAMMAGSSSAESNRVGMRWPRGGWVTRRSAPASTSPSRRILSRVQ